MKETSCCWSRRWLEFATQTFLYDRQYQSQVVNKAYSLYIYVVVPWQFSFVKLHMSLHFTFINRMFGAMPPMPSRCDGSARQGSYSLSALQLLVTNLHATEEGGPRDAGSAKGTEV